MLELKLKRKKLSSLLLFPARREETQMKIIIIGAGAMGSLYGAYLTKGKENVLLLDHWEEHVKKILDTGLTVMSESEQFSVRPRASVLAENYGPADLIIICVKSTETEVAALLAEPLMKAETRILTLQNGMGNAEKLAEMLGPERILVGSTLMGAVLLEPGLVMRSDIKNTHIASWTSGNVQWLEQVAEVLNHSGLPTIIETNVISLLWSKLSIHAGLNAVTALTGATNKQFLELPEAVRLARMIVGEVVAVATAADIPLLYPNCANEMMVYAGAMKEYHSPMLQDIMHKRKTEVSVLNCEVVKAGRRYGIPTPVNEAVALAIASIESLYMGQ